MNAIYLTWSIIISLWMALQGVQGSQIEERILPSKTSTYLFQEDTIIKAACTFTSDTEIKMVTWEYVVQTPSRIEKDLSNKTNETTIINTWQANRTVIRSVLLVLDIPRTHEIFYYRCSNDDGKLSSIMYQVISEKNIPKVSLKVTTTAKKEVVRNKTLEGVYNSSMNISCELIFETHKKVENNVNIELRKNNKIIGVKVQVPYQQAKGMLLKYPIKEMEADNGGFYSCSSEMLIEKKKFTSMQYMNLIFPLRLTGYKEKEVTSFPGQDVELVCEIEGFPIPKWTFRYQNGSFRNDSNITLVNNLLKIPDVRLRDGGLYICTAKDQVGNMKTQNITLNVIFINKALQCSQKIFFPIYLMLVILDWLEM